jgi:hypothetical protein
MRPRPSLVVAVTSGLCGLVLGLTLGRPSTAQPAAPVTQGQQDGRYHISVDSTAMPYDVVGDTGTGRCWSRLASGKGGWMDLGAPSAARR